MYQQCSSARRTRPRGRSLTRYCGPSPFQPAASDRCRQHHPRNRLSFTMLHKTQSSSWSLPMLFRSVASRVLHKESIELASIASSHLPHTVYVKHSCVCVCVLDLLAHFLGLEPSLRKVQITCFHRFLQHLEQSAAIHLEHAKRMGARHCRAGRYSGSRHRPGFCQKDQS